MKICAYCGGSNDDRTGTCAFCGAPLPAAAEEAGAASSSSEESDYEVILTGRGTCSRTVLNDLLEDLVGYTDQEAEKLINSIPSRIGYAMTRAQAVTLAQGLTEYGARVAVYDPEGKALPGVSGASRVFGIDGSLAAWALAILGTLGAANRVRAYETYRRPGLLESLFGLETVRREPPRHVRRSIVHTGRPMPPPRRKLGLIQALFGIGAPPRPPREPLSRREPSPSVWGPANRDIGSGRRNPSPSVRDRGIPGLGRSRQNGGPDSGRRGGRPGPFGPGRPGGMGPGRR